MRNGRGRGGWGDGGGGAGVQARGGGAGVRGAGRAPGPASLRASFVRRQSLLSTMRAPLFWMMYLRFSTRFGSAMLGL